MPDGNVPPNPAGTAAWREGDSELPLDPHWHDGPDEFVDYGNAGGGWRTTSWRCYLPCCANGHDWTPPVRVGFFRQRTVQRCRYRSLPYDRACYAEKVPDDD